MTEDRLRKQEWEVRSVHIREARAIVEQHHYARAASNTATALHGLFPAGLDVLCGVAWWLPPIRPVAVFVWRAAPEAVLGLSRLVLLPGCPKNAATYLLMRSVRLLALRWQCLCTYADTWRGHTGHIYRAAGWEYLGVSRPKPVYTRDGRVVSLKSDDDTRNHDRMLAMGAELVGRHAKHRYRLVRQDAVAFAAKEALS